MKYINYSDPTSQKQQKLLQNKSVLLFVVSQTRTPIQTHTHIYSHYID